MSELALRVLFSVVAAPLALLIVLAGGAPLAALLAIVCAIGAWEFFRIARGAGAHPMADAGIALAGLIPLAVHASYLGLFTIRPAVWAMLVLLLLGASIWLRGVEGKPLAAVGTTLLGVEAVIAESFERIHRSNLVGMGVLPVKVSGNVTRKTLNLTGEETITLKGMAAGIKPRMKVDMVITRKDGGTQMVHLL